MGIYKYSKACPRCREHGGDTRGDNLAIYHDGSGYCFSCGFYKPPDFVSTDHESTWTALELTELPQKFITYLSKFDLKEEECKHFGYNTHMDRMVFQVDGFWEARSLDRNPKCLSKGKKQFIPFGTGDPLVLVEDVISAIKVARVTRAVPLFGSVLRTEFIPEIMKYKSVIVWLDRDKFKESLELSARISQVTYSRVVSTEKDPKYLSTEEINKLVHRVED